MIMEEILTQMRKYRTAVFEEDMREENYAGPIQPDISGFIKTEIIKILNNEDGR